MSNESRVILPLIEMTDEIERREVTRQRDGAKVTVVKQFGWLYNGERFPAKCSVSLGERVPFAPGKYFIPAHGLQVGRYERLELAYDLPLVPAVDGLVFNLETGQLVSGPRKVA